MNQIPCCDWLPEQARWSGAILHAQDLLLGEFFGVLCHNYNKSFTDQACSVKMAGYWPCSFFCVFIDLNLFLVHKCAKKELGQYLAILTPYLVNNPDLLARNCQQNSVFFSFPSRH